MPKLGYRFIASVERDAVESESGAPITPIPFLKRRALMWAVATGLSIAATSVGAFFLVARRAQPHTGRPVPLTTFRGYECDPALSPDGSHVAFVWNGEKQDNFDIYVMRIGSDAPFRLTTDPQDDASPAWSPAGDRIAFLRQVGESRGELVVVAATGGPEQKLHDIRDQQLRGHADKLASLAWSPDGRWIAAAHRGPSDSSARIHLFSLTGEMRPLTSAPGFEGDHTPAFAPDGHALAFTRLGGYSTSEVYVLPLAPDLQPLGEARRMTASKRWCVNPTWTTDGHAILFLCAAEPDARHELRILATPGSPGSESVIPFDNDVSQVTLGRRLVYSVRVRDTNIWRARIPAQGEPPAAGKMLISSTRLDDRARYSPDGTKIAFNSTRSGTSEIWVSKADGSNAVRLTSFGGPLVGFPNWSPDGQWLVFHARPEGQADVFVIPAAGGPVKRLTQQEGDDTMPSYSHDGRWIYFSSWRSGLQQIWRMNAEGGELLRLTTSEGYRPTESQDGKTIFYIARDGSGIWSFPAEGGQAIKVVGPIHHYPSGFAVAADGIYYQAPPHSGEQRFIRYLSFSGAENRPIAVANHAFNFGVSVSPDSKYILFDQHDESGSDLMLVENFRPR